MVSLVGGSVIAVNDSSSGCPGGHYWIGYWPEGIPDGVPCSCGAVKYERRQSLREQIAELQRQLAELEN